MPTIQKHRLPIETLARLPKRLFVTPSHAGDQVAFFGDQTGRFELYTLNLVTGDLKQCTNGQSPKGLRAGFVWRHDDKAIVFCKDQDGDERHNLFMLDLDTLAVTQLNDDPTTQEYVTAFTPDDSGLLVASNRDDQQSLYRFDFSAHTWTRLTHAASPVSEGKYSPDGSNIAYVANETDDLQNSDVYIMNADGSDARMVLRVEAGSGDEFADWHPDGNRMAVTSDATGANRPGIFNIASGDVHWLGDEGVEEHAVSFSDDGRWLVTLRNQDATITPRLYDVETGDLRELKLPPGVAVGTHFVLDDSKLLLTYGTSSRLSEVLLYDLTTDEVDVLLAADYCGVSPDLFVPSVHVWYPSSDGQMVPALLYRPEHIPEGAQLPAIIDVHGGPTGQYFRNFNLLSQFLVDQGYVVLQPNFRGSTGYGRAWREANIMDWGGGDLEDVAAGVDFLKTLPYIDEKRLAVFGGSYGGYMSFMASVKKPALFKVAVPWVGITDVLSLYEESMAHFKYFLRAFFGTPEENEALYRERSAITFAEELQAKMLIVHGVNDPRCPISQARRFRDKLISLGRSEGQAASDDFEYLEFADEGHGSSGDAEGTLRMMRVLGEFLERRL